jgi:hypothetical protein
MCGKRLVHLVSAEDLMQVGVSKGDVPGPRNVKANEDIKSWIYAHLVEQGLWRL